MSSWVFFTGLICSYGSSKGNEFNFGLTTRNSSLIRSCVGCISVFVEVSGLRSIFMTGMKEVFYFCLSINEQ